MIVLRTLAILAGIGILAAVAHATITATGGYGWNTNAPLTIALTVGVALGAPVASLSRAALAIVLCLALVAGEAYGFLATACWHVANIEAQAAPIHDAEARHAAAKARLEAAEHSEVVQRAIDVQTAHASEALVRSADKSCNAVCKAKIVDTARTDQGAVDAAKQSKQGEIDAARAALANSPCPAQQTRWRTALACSPGSSTCLAPGFVASHALSWRAVYWPSQLTLAKRRLCPRRCPRPRRSPVSWSIVSSPHPGRASRVQISTRHSVSGAK